MLSILIFLQRSHIFLSYILMPLVSISQIIKDFSSMFNKTKRITSNWVSKQCFDKSFQPHSLLHKFVKQVYHSHCDGKSECRRVLVRVLTKLTLRLTSQTWHRISKIFKQLKDKDIKHTLKWNIAVFASTYSCGSRRCNLFLKEKYITGEFIK